MVVNVKYLVTRVMIFISALSSINAQPDEYTRYSELLAEYIVPITEVSVFSTSPIENTILLENGYAQFEIKNPLDWPPQGKDVIPTKVELVFSQYPKNYNDWITDYDDLLTNRFRALEKIDSSLLDKSVKVEIVLQTDCENEFEAMQLFHGARITYKEKAITQKEPETEDLITEVSPVEKNELSPSTQGYIKKIRRFMIKEKYTMDSTVFNILERNNWQNAHLVMDWTGSMYGYGAEALLWHAMKEGESSISNFTLFNDGDRKKNRKKVLGSTGGIYTANSTSLSKLLKLIKRVKNKGDGGDSPENDIEALIKVLESSKDQEIVLLADNKSCIRDYVLLECLNRPIHIILSDSRRGINHQYLNLAWNTGGSIHTRTLDIDSIDSEIEDGGIQIGSVYYTLTEEGRILPVDRSLDRFTFCGRYYRGPKRKKKRKKPVPGC